MSLKDDHRALLSLLSRFDGTANGRRAVDIARELVEVPRLPQDLVPVINAVARVRAAEGAEREAYETRVAAETQLAELVGVRRRDKDMAFDADFEARQMIVAAAIEAAQPLSDSDTGGS